MIFLVADVGGTNTRLALADDQGKLSGPIAHFANADYRSFADVVDTFFARQKISRVSACCVAMAGPVTAGQARLTNLDWHISVAELRRITGTEHAILMNDLTALGCSLSLLRPSGVKQIFQPETDIYRNGQSLIVGIGTGFNVCPLKVETGGFPSCLSVELGHVGLPLALVNLLEKALPGEAHRFHTVEDCFSGSGLTEIFNLSGGDPSLSGGQIVARHSGGVDPAATSALELFAGLLGELCKEMVLQYLPLDGIYFAGSVARGLFQSGLSSVFLAAFANHRQFRDQLSNIPVALILDDAAALLGCANACRSR